MPEKLFSQPRSISIFLFAIAVILYINTVPNNYALDDAIVNTQNIYVQKGIAGIGDIFGKETFTGFFKQKKDLVEGGRYRPLSLVTFAIEKSIWKGNPHISHLLNVILYGLLCVLLFFCLKKILVFIGYADLAVPVSFLASLLFTVHPLHTEVVANIKGRDELLSLLFCLGAIYYVILFYETQQFGKLVWAGIMLFLGLLAKENAIIIPVLAAIVIFLGSCKKIKANNLTTFLVLSATAFIYFLIRSKVIGQTSGKIGDELMNNPFLYASPSQKLATILYTLFIYLKLLVFPYPLTYDYYPYHIQLQEWSNPLVILSVLIYVSLVLFSAYGLVNRKYKISTISVLIYLVTILPLSNLFINTGTFMNERFVFYGSIGFCLIVGLGLFNLLKTLRTNRFSKSIVVACFTIVLLVYSVRTVARNADWKDNYTLFTHDVQISSGSAKANVTAGGAILEKATAETDSVTRKKLLDLSVGYLEKAIAIYPTYIDALLLAGNAYFQRDQDFKSADQCYSRIFNRASTYDLAFSNYKIILASVKEPVVRKYGYLKILSYRPDDFDANSELGSLYGKVFNNLDSAIYYLERAVRLKPNSKDANRDLGVAYGMKGQPEKAVTFFERTVQLDNDDPSNHINLGLAYQQLGQNEKANRQFMIAKELQSIKK